MGRAVKYGAAAGWGWGWDWVGPPKKKGPVSENQFRVPWRQRPHPHAPGAARGGGERERERGYLLLGGLPPDLRGVFLIPGKRISRARLLLGLPSSRERTRPAERWGERKEGRRFIPGEARMDGPEI